IGWASSLKDGKPLDGVDLTLLPSGAKAAARGDGVSRIALPAGHRKGSGTALLVARKGGDVAILPEHQSWWSDESTWFKRPPHDFLRWYVFDDRGMYKPGEQVRVKGWVRRAGGDKDGDVGPAHGFGSEIAYKVKDSRGNIVREARAALNALGGFDTSFKLPDAMNLGAAAMELRPVNISPALEDQQFVHPFLVQEFRRPEFEVSASASEGLHIIGTHADVTVKAAYYAGGGLVNADVNWTVTATPASFIPPNRRDFSFGEWTPWWRTSVLSWGMNGSYDSPTRSETLRGQTDSLGKHHLRIDFDSSIPPRAMDVVAQASVMDVNRQAWTATSNMLVHPAELYCGLLSPRTFVQPGQPPVVHP